MAFCGPCWPPGVDGTTYLPRYHRKLTSPAASDDGPVAVDVVIPPGTAEEPHTHCRPSFMLVDSPTAIAVTLVDENGAQKEVFRRAEGSSAPLAQANFEAMDPEPLHFVANLQADRSLRATRIEFPDKLLRADAGSSPDTPPVPGPVAPSIFGDDEAACRLVGEWVMAASAARGWIVTPQADTTPLRTPAGVTIFVVQSSVGQAVAGRASVSVGSKRLAPMTGDTTGVPEDEARPSVWLLPSEGEPAALEVTGEGAARSVFIIEFQRW